MCDDVPVEFMGNAVKSVWHGVKDAGEWVGHTAEEGVHDVATAAKDTAKFATHAVVDVGNAVAGVIKHIPVVGGTIADGIGAVTDLATKADDLQQDMWNTAEHPIDTAESVANVVTHPALLVKKAKAGLKTVDQVANDALAIGAAVAAVDPEMGGPELADALRMAQKVKSVISKVKTISKVARDVSQGHLLKAVRQGRNILPKKLRKVANVTLKVAKYGKQAKSMVDAMHGCGDFSFGKTAPIYTTDIIRYGKNYSRLLSQIKFRYPGDVTLHCFNNEDYIGSIALR